MYQTLDRSLFDLVAASPATAVGLLGVSIFIADYFIVFVPIGLVLKWIAGGTEDRTVAVSAILAAVVSLAAAGAVSLLIMHPRPFMDGLAPNILNHSADSSMPSDHATVVFAVAFSLLFAGSRRLGIAMLAVAILVGWSRVFLGVHYPIDIAAGALLGAASAMLVRTSGGQALSRWLANLGSTLCGMVLPKRKPG
jgi:undecaprenyl-diphosphatase